MPLDEKDERYPVVYVHTWCKPLAQRHEFVVPPDIHQLGGPAEPGGATTYEITRTEEEVAKGERLADDLIRQAVRRQGACLICREPADLERRHVVALIPEGKLGVVHDGECFAEANKRPSVFSTVHAK